MKKILLTFGFLFLFNNNSIAADSIIQNIDTNARVQNPNTNSIMFRRNAEHYRQLSDAEKEEIEARRKASRERRLQEEEFARRKAMEEARIRAEQEAMMEAERQRREALKPITLYENKLKIYALVNGEIVSSNDMQSRINAFILTTGIPYNKQTKSMITQKVLQSAIDEKLKLQEAAKHNIKISQKEINEAIKNFEQSNNLPAGGLKDILDEAKVSLKDWSRQIESDLAWRKLITSKGYNVINISVNDINNAINEIKNDNKVQRFLVSEIVIDKKKAKDISQLVDNLRQDPRFELYAMQFSESPSSANGGNLGWVKKGRLPKVLENAILGLGEGDVSDPISYGSNYYIFKLQRIFTPGKSTVEIPSNNEIRAFLENKKLEEYSNKYIKDLRSRALIEKKI